jgi:transposase, IS5 family
MKFEGRSQMSFMYYDLEKMVKEDHFLKQLEEIINIKYLIYRVPELKSLDKNIGRKGYGVEVGIRCLILQFKYDLSDRALAERLYYDIAFKWYCGFEFDEQTPEHTYFTRIRKALGTKIISKVFKQINKQAKEKGIIRNLFAFVDASAIIAKETTWEERDRALKLGEEKLNNDNIDKYSSDKDARFGCKGKNKFWYGYKNNISADMGSGLIECTTVTPANISDTKAFKHICPKNKIIFGDKAYCLKYAQMIMKQNNCESAVILKNNMKDKNKDRDRFISKIRSPFENIFSKNKRKAKYKGLAKVQMQAFMEAIIFNCNRLIKINSPPLFSTAT